MAVPSPVQGRCPGGLELGQSCSSGVGDRAEDRAQALSPGREGSSCAGWSQYRGVRPGGSGQQHSQTGLPARRCLASDPPFLHLPPNRVSGEHAPSTLRAEDAPGLPLQPRPAQPRPEAPGWGRLGCLPPSVKNGRVSVRPWAGQHQDGKTGLSSDPGPGDICPRLGCLPGVDARQQTTKT